MRVEAIYARDLKNYSDQLRALEREMTYPIADGGDHFYIDHGADYGRFFLEMSRDPNDPNASGFLVAFDGERVVGTWGGVIRTALVGDREVTSIYFGDYKVARDHRGGKVTGAMWIKALGLMRHGEIRAVRVFYAAAMRGARGDVMRTARGRVRLMKFGRPDGTLAIYFVAPEKLASLDLSSAPEPPRGEGLDLSPHTLVDHLSTAGRKDLRLVSTGKPWPLEHLPLGPRHWTDGLGGYLKRCGEKLSNTTCCFAVDQRLDDHVRWLRGQGIEPGAACTVYTFRLPPARGPIAWTHLATSEI
jgi:hypothetical protein